MGADSVFGDVVVTVRTITSNTFEGRVVITIADRRYGLWFARGGLVGLEPATGKVQRANVSHAASALPSSQNVWSMPVGGSATPTRTAMARWKRSGWI